MRIPRDPTGIDDRIETVTGRSIEALWQLDDSKLLAEPVSSLVHAHRALAKAQSALVFNRVQIQRLTSGQFEIDGSVLTRIDRGLVQLKESVATRDLLLSEALTLLAPLEKDALRPTRSLGDEISPPDFARLLAMARGAKLHENIMTRRVSVATATGVKVDQYDFERLEGAGLVTRDTSHPLHAGQPVHVTDLGRSVLAGSRRSAISARPLPQGCCKVFWSWIVAGQERPRSSRGRRKQS
ncbi:hypothetical protein OTB20_41835 [Streptomyces sp. H27-H1]|uniref:hypothetical protein n=1 Tax=Streptomyces sp. H27-H1 TaxID=2996461 RepID=UPI00226F5B27|nr:hypothetical protein [Streptomyces sp. H27-H1]MCY0932553.1 hypothetical protein [Streptomyces sp. H27-H1]